MSAFFGSTRTSAKSLPRTQTLRSELTRCQLSPIFGLYNDPRRDVAGLLYHDLGRPELSGTLDGVKHDLWSVHDPDKENELITRVGPGTPMGATMRRYWMPTLLSSELPRADSNPGGDY